MEIGCRTRVHTEKKAQSTQNVTLISAQALFAFFYASLAVSK